MPIFGFTDADIFIYGLYRGTGVRWWEKQGIGDFVAGEGRLITARRAV